MLSPRDYFVIAFYLAFMLGLGFVFKRFSKNTNEYFRGGGSMLWWLSGASAMMSAVSAWSFTGAAGAIYQTGTIVTVLYLSNLVGITLMLIFNCARFRRMRVVTYAEAIRLRFGRATEQFYVWAQVPTGLVFAGLQINAVGVFMAAVFLTPVIPTILVLSAVVIVMALFGGAWAVVAGDFLQFMMMVIVLGLSAYFALGQPEVGGLSGLIERVPATHFDWTSLLRPEILVIWCLGMLLAQSSDFNSLTGGAARFIMVKDEQHARKAAVFMLCGMVLLATLLVIPPLVATIVMPDIQAQFPALERPHEAAFVAISVHVMPPGLIGLLVAGIFAVAMASMDTGLNRNAGVFVRNFYGVVLRPQAGDRELMIVAKVCTLLFGIIVAVIGCLFSELRTLDLFGTMLAVTSLLGFPLAVPMVLGLIVRGAPALAGWSTAVLGVVTAWLLRYFQVSKTVEGWMGWENLTEREHGNFDYALTVIVIVAVETLWFLFLTWRHRGKAVEPSVQTFFANVDRPIDPRTEPSEDQDRAQYLTMGRLSLIYGAGIACFALMPNRLDGRMAFLLCGGVIALIGYALLRRGRALPRPDAAGTQLP